MTDSTPSGLLRSFPRVFWVANVMELFERAAYYGLNSVLAIYLTNSVSERGLGFSEQSVGFLQGIIYALTYIIPILGGALADRYGYRRMLVFAFSLLSVAGLVTLRGPLLRKLSRRRQGPAELVREQAVLLEDLPAGGVARAELRGTTWSARSIWKTTLMSGQRCVVERVEGLTLWVRPE